MADITLDRLDRGTKFGSGTADAVGLFMSLADRYRRWRRYRTTKAELAQYSATELTELGISEADIDRIARDAVDR